MALDLQSISATTRARLYGAGLGEKPSIVQGGGGTATVVGDIVTFDVAAGKGAGLREGHVLTAYNPVVDADYGFYVLSPSTDTITAINGYDGAAIADAASIPALMEVNAPVNARDLFNAIDEIIDGYLWPEVFDIVVDSLTPNQSTSQTNADTLDEKIIRGWQKSGNTVQRIPIKLTKDIGTSEFASGKMISYDAFGSATVYYTSLRRVSSANSTALALDGILAKGAAALVSEGVSLDGLWESSRADAQDRSERSPSERLWKSFNTAKRQYAEDLSRDTALEFTVDRG